MSSFRQFSCQRGADAEDASLLVVTHARHTLTTRATPQSWTEWQQDVVSLLRDDFCEVLQEIGIDDVDWPSWRTFFVQGRSPRAAVDRAMERDL